MNASQPGTGKGLLCTICGTPYERLALPAQVIGEVALPSGIEMPAYRPDKVAQALVERISPGPRLLRCAAAHACPCGSPGGSPPDPAGPHRVAGTLVCPPQDQAAK